MHKVIFPALIFLLSTFGNTLYSAEKNTPIVTIKICTIDTGFGKYTTPAGDGIWQKITSDAIKDLNVKLVMVFAPRERCMLKIRKNDIDAVYAAETLERKKFLIFPVNKSQATDNSKIVGVVQYKIYKNKNSNINWDGKKFLNLGGNSIGVQRGLLVEQLLRDNKIKVDGDLVNTPEQNLTKLHLGRIVAAAIEEKAADEFIKASGFNEIVKLEKTFAESQVYLAFSHDFYHKHQDLAEKIWSNINVSRKKIKNLPANIKFDFKAYMATL